jgi:hypothetical protein
MSHLSVAQQVYSDVLSAVFAFFSWTDLVLAARTCKSWLIAAGKGKRRDVSLELTSESAVRGLLASSLRCHVTASTISQLVLCLPSLTSLVHRACVRIAIDNKEEVVMPVYSPRLQVLQVYWAASRQHEPHLLECAAATAPNLTELALIGISRRDENWTSLSVDCFTHLQQLTTLTISGGRMSAKFVAAIANLPALTKITAYDHAWSVADLEVLARGVCNLQRFDLLSTRVTLSIMHSLLLMPSINSLVLYECDPQVMFQLRHFPNLTDLQLDTWSVSAAVSITQEFLRAALTGCTQLRKLRICQRGGIKSITSTLLMSLDAAPLLTELDLDAVKLTSCDFLQFVPRLTNLRLCAHANQDPPTASLLQALCQYVPLLTSLECRAGIFSSDARYALARCGHAQFLPHLVHLTLTR